jgi:hypothetical protein
MTPQEKAKALVEKMFNLSTTNAFPAKQCALITVDEIIESREDDGSFNDTIWGHDSEYYSMHPMYLTYWLEVKKEINKL